MVLLNMLSDLSQLNLVVAHFDHGIRQDSSMDRDLVQAVAKEYGLPFVFAEGHLGSSASEAVARETRYKFLESAAKDAGAQSIITAHHQDDLLETAIINMLRGTGRRGLTSLKNQPGLLRPLLEFSKAEIIDFAKKHKIQWREDSTNQDINYLRNYVRRKILTRFSADQKNLLLEHINKLSSLNVDIDKLIVDLATSQPELDRQLFISLDHNIARDLMAGWLRVNNVTTIDSKRLELLVRAAKTYAPGKQQDIDKGHSLRVGKDRLALVGGER